MAISWKGIFYPMEKEEQFKSKAVNDAWASTVERLEKALCREVEES